MDADLKSIASARRAAETAFNAYRQFLGTDPTHIDAIVDAMARAIEPEAKRLGEMAVEETGYGNIPDKRVKNLFNALSVALGQRREVHHDLTAKPPQPQGARQGAESGDIGSKTRRRIGVSAGVHIDGHQGPGRLDQDRAFGKPFLGPRQGVDHIVHPAARESAFVLIEDIGHGPLAQGQFAR